MNNKSKSGPKTGEITVKATVLLGPEIRDWGTAQPGGLSDLTRKLLRKEKERLDRLLPKG